MKSIIIEGPDRTGKNTIIRQLCEYYSYDNVHVRHCAKPPKNIGIDDVYKWQMRAFIEEGKLVKHLAEMERIENRYYENIVIHNRYYPGEYVYGIMWRGYRPEFISEKLRSFESYYVDLNNTLLVTLHADPEFLMSKEDGNSFSQTEQKKKEESDLFLEFHEKSMIRNKLAIKVNVGSEWKNSAHIINEVLRAIP